jgi:tripartite-type tricarboxylate transporter receptor subunit TctC
MKGQCVAAALLVLGGLGNVRAQDYPARTVTIIVPFAPGGPADVTGRIVADIFSRHLGQQFVVANVGGAGGTIGSCAQRVPQPTAIRSFPATWARTPRRRFSIPTWAMTPRRTSSRSA